LPGTKEASPDERRIRLPADFVENPTIRPGSKNTWFGPPLFPKYPGFTKGAPPIPSTRENPWREVVSGSELTQGDVIANGLSRAN
jgi:hypothetical protein